MSEHASGEKPGRIRAVLKRDEKTQKASEFREKRFRWAVLTSLSSKVTTALLQLVAMPVAARCLGNHGFALYSMLTALVVWLWISNIGIGPSLTVALAAARARKDDDEERRLFSSAFYSVLGVATIATLVGLVLAWVIPIPLFFGTRYLAEAATIRWGLTLLVALFFSQMILSLYESALTGYQEQHIVNLNFTFNSLPAILAMLWVASHHPTVIGMILAVNAPVVASRVFNVGWALWRHPSTRPSLTWLHRGSCASLAKNGLSFSLAGMLGYILSHVFPIVLVGRTCTSDGSAAFAVVMNTILLASGVFAMVCTPMWPAIADSTARGERAWAGAAYRKLLALCMGYAALVAVVLVGWGPRLFDLWFHGQIHPDPGLILAASVYFMALGWEQVHFSILMGFRRIKLAALLVCARAVLATGVTLRLLGTGREYVPFVVMAICVMLVEAIPLWRLVKRNLSSHLLDTGGDGGEVDPG